MNYDYEFHCARAEEPVFAGKSCGRAHRRNNGAARPVLQAADRRHAVRRSRLGERHPERGTREELRTRPKDQRPHGPRRARVSRDAVNMRAIQMTSYECLRSITCTVLSQ